MTVRSPCSSSESCVSSVRVVGRAVQAVSVSIRPAVLALRIGLGVIEHDGGGAIGGDREARKSLVRNLGSMDDAGQIFHGNPSFWPPAD